MSYNKITWKDRQSEYPNRRLLTQVENSPGLYEVAREEGNIFQEGQAFDQATMNDLESRVEAAFVALESGSQKAGRALAADAVAWAGVSGKPASYPPSGHGHTPGEAGAAPASHSHPASQVTAGTLPTGVLATSSTDYGTARLRNAYFATAAPGSLASGTVCFVYE